MRRLASEISSRLGLELRYNLELLYVTVLPSGTLSQLEALLMEHLGAAYKPRGRTAIFKNFFDRFVQGVGGIQRNQGLFRRDFGTDISLYAAIWPWASDPMKVSLRVGIYCPLPELRNDLKLQLASRER